MYITSGMIVLCFVFVNLAENSTNLHSDVKVKLDARNMILFSTSLLSSTISTTYIILTYIDTHLHRHICIYLDNLFIRTQNAATFILTV